MIRGRSTITVRSRPEQRTGKTNGRDWSFFSVAVLDEDYNKEDLTLDPDVVDLTMFGEGARVEVVYDAVASDGRLRLRCVNARPAGVPAAAAAGSK